MSGLAGLPRSVPAFFVSRGNGTETEFCGTSGTGAKFRGTAPHGCPAGQSGFGKKRGTVPSRPCPSLYLRFYYRTLPEYLSVWRQLDRPSSWLHL